MLWIKTDKQQSAHDLAPKSFFYSPAPMLLLNRDCIVLEVNCALRELTKTDPAVCKGRSYEHLVMQIGANLQGSLISHSSIIAKHLLRSGEGFSGFKLEDLSINEEICIYNTPEFGAAKLRTTETPLIDVSTGDIQGALLSMEILEIEHRSQYQDALRKRFTHELMWEIYAASYDRILLELPFYQEVLKRHISAMSSSAIKHILDIGAGTGNVSVQLLQKDKIITAVDTSNAMLKKFYSKLDEVVVTNLTIIEDTAERLPHLEKGCFDGITVLLAFFDMQDPFSALEEAIRLLKSGGTLIVTEPKACFNVTELMAFAERHLREKGLMERLGGLDSNPNRSASYQSENPGASIFEKRLPSAMACRNAL